MSLLKHYRAALGERIAQDDALQVDTTAAERELDQAIRYAEMTKKKLKSGDYADAAIYMAIIADSGIAALLAFGNKIPDVLKRYPKFSKAVKQFAKTNHAQKMRDVTGTGDKLS